MAVREKMSRENRAKQFNPFDALKGLQQALRMKEYEHERNIKGDVDEEKIAEMTKILTNLKRHDCLKVKYFSDGYYLIKQGEASLNFENMTLKMGKKEISLDDVFDLELMQNE